MSASRDAEPRVVLLALDGSPAAAAAAGAARLVARQLNCTLRVLHVAPQDEPEEALRRRLQLDRYHLEDCDLHIHHGPPAAGILEMVDDPSSTMIVLTTHGRDVEQGRHLGRVAEAVVAGTTRPVMLIRPEAAAAATAALEVRHLLLPLDGAPTTLRALADLAQLACRLDASLELLFVVAPDVVASTGAGNEAGTIGVPRYVDQPQHEWPAWGREVVMRLGASCEGLPPRGLPTRVFVARGRIEDEIVRFAAEHREDVVVLVRRSELEPGHARVLRAVLERTPCPVLLTGAARRPAAAQREGRSWHGRMSTGRPLVNAGAV